MAALARGVDADIMAALEAGNFHPVVLIYLDWPTGEVRYHSNAGTITFDGHDYGGVGPYGDISYPGEGAGMIAERVALSVIGTPEDLMNDAEAEVRNRDGALYLGLTTERGGTTLVGTPVTIWSGYMDALHYEVHRDGEDVQHALRLELGSGPSARAVASAYHSYEDQQARHPGDTSGRHLIEIEKRVQTLERA